MPVAQYAVRPLSMILWWSVETPWSRGANRAWLI
jgi:hypothetical protein